MDESPQRHMLRARDVAFGEGPSGRALVTGPTSYLRVASSRALDGDGATFEAWVQLTSLPGTDLRAVIAEHEGRWVFYVRPDGSLRCRTDGGSVTSPPILKVKEWASVACTLDREHVAIWVEGKQVARERVQGSAPSPDERGAAVAHNLPSGDNLLGSIDNVRLWTVVRTQPELCEASRACAR
jgi:hypothetical protein